MLPTILRSYGWAAKTFAASDKGWHLFFVNIPHGPKLLHPKELAVAQGFPWGFALPSCRTQAWQLLENFVPPPMVYFGLVGPAAAIRGPARDEQGSDWAAEGFRKCCQASDGAWEPIRGALGQVHGAHSPGRSKTPPRHQERAQGNQGIFAVRPPRQPSPQVAMIQGRRASEEEAPTSIWLDPPTGRETQDFLVVFQATRSGTFVVESSPGATHRGAFRVRGMDRPPRQGTVTSAPLSPDSVAEPSPREFERPRSPTAAGAGCPARAFATLTLVTLAAGADGAGLSLGRTRACNVAQNAGHGTWRPALGPWSAGSDVPGPARPRLWWSPAIGSYTKDFDATLGYPGEGPQLPRTTPSLKTETLTLVTANVTSWSTGTDAGVLSLDSEVWLRDEVLQGGKGRI